MFTTNSTFFFRSLNAFKSASRRQYLALQPNIKECSNPKLVASRERIQNATTIVPYTQARKLPKHTNWEQIHKRKGSQRPYDSEPSKAEHRLSKMITHETARVYKQTTKETKSKHLHTNAIKQAQTICDNIHETEHATWTAPAQSRWHTSREQHINNAISLPGPKSAGKAMA